MGSAGERLSGTHSLGRAGLQRYRLAMFRLLVLFPPSADPTEVDVLIEGTASAFRASAGYQRVTRNTGSLMGPGARTREAGWIFEADFLTLEDAMAAVGAEAFQDVKQATEALTSSIFLFEVAEL
mgnify:CR=1 FL=1